MDTMFMSNDSDSFMITDLNEQLFSKHLDTSDFPVDDFCFALIHYKNRDRRFGGRQ